MTDIAEAARARAYLLGTLEDRDRDHVEESYVANAGALETIEAAEESLIDDYLSGRLSSDERGRFERHYLSAPHRRTRVETIRRLRGAAQRTRKGSQLGWLALAAGLVLAAGAALWISRQSMSTSTSHTPAAAAPAAASAAAPAPFVFALAPVTVRSASETDNPALVVPPATGVVDLQLQGDGSTPPVARGRALLRTVAGADVWQGPVEVSTRPRADAIATVEIPAALLRPDDYTVTLLEISTSGVESERLRYFLRVRAH
jgi:hypothetical protein